ncbi:MAG: CPBP family intramembrane metalloprotease [Prevotella sp.]|nr:CPBP family intramembrane metalloprotease [Alistipes senegalensis]MCM1357379.1 CPBP family intramembrane metalloprotease [Prevotella sp.]MCM1473741.1 CPBP family intramembrane metalloprotease [Muribaculaceae bacterium]
MNKPKIFEESGESLASPALPVQIFSFFIVFLIIYVLEAIIPSIVSIKPMLEEMNSQGMLDGNKIELKKSMAAATVISASPEIMIPSLLSTVFGTITSIIYCRNIEVRPITSMGVRKQKLIPHYLTGLLTGIIMMTAITLLSVCFGANKILLCNNINFGVIMLYLLGFFVQGMSEEFIFRGYLLTTVGGYHSVWVAVAVNSGAFALAHVFNPGFDVLPCVNLVLFGVFASLYMICFDDIWGVCGIHSIWNFMQGNFYGISVSGTGDSESVFRTTARTSHAWLSGGEFGIEGSIFTTVILSTGIIIVFLKIKKDKSPT